MAESPAHRLGQIIGDALEIAIEPILRDFAVEHDLYLDRKGIRPARPGKLVKWVDVNGNKHDLDFVLERGGTDDVIGVPAAFVESAWRRYTKHSRNKAQEMQGAIEPLLRQYSSAKPFAGAIVGGDWTEPSIAQMRSVGFSVVHLTYSEIVAAFATVGIDAATREDTPLVQLAEAVTRCEALDTNSKAALGAALRACAPEDFAQFQEALEAMVIRKVTRITVLPLYGTAAEYATVEEAIDAITDYEPPTEVPPGVRWEIIVKFSNGDRIEAQFGEMSRTVDFLRTFT